MHQIDGCSFENVCEHPENERCPAAERACVCASASNMLRRAHAHHWVHSRVSLRCRDPFYTKWLHIDVSAFCCARQCLHLWNLGVPIVLSLLSCILQLHSAVFSQRLWRHANSFLSERTQEQEHGCESEHANVLMQHIWLFVGNQNIHATHLLRMLSSPRCIKRYGLWRLNQWKQN